MRLLSSLVFVAGLMPVLPATAADLPELRMGLVKDLDGSPSSSGLPRNLTREFAQPLGNRLYFQANVRPPGALVGANGLWRTDGTDAGTGLLPSGLYDGRVVSRLQTLGGDILFLTSYNLHDPVRVFRVEADFSAASLLRENIGTPYLQPTGDGQTVVFLCGSSGVFCVARAADPAMTVLTTSLASGVNAPIGAIGGVAVFGSPSDSNEIWRSDGTAPGTFRLAGDRTLRSASRYKSAVLNGKLYFASCAADGSDCQLNFTDGTVAGTGSVLPLSTNVLQATANLGDRMLFVLPGPQSGSRQLWSSDGTAGGMQLLWSGVVHSSSGAELVVAGGYAHLIVGCTSCGAASYIVSDGSAAGTRELQMPASHVPMAWFLEPLQDQVVVFSCSSSASGIELCATDPAGTTVSPLPDIYPGDDASYPSVLGQAGDTLYFGADDGSHGYELWKMRIWSDAVFADGFEQPAR